jgi:hypothetical protein
VVVASKVDAFLDSWPCNGVNWRGPIRFEYSSNGDLVDMWPSDIDGEAILALSEDAQNFGDKCCEKRRDS